MIIDQVESSPTYSRVCISKYMYRYTVHDLWRNVFNLFPVAQQFYKGILKKYHDIFKFINSVNFQCQLNKTKEIRNFLKQSCICKTFCFEHDQKLMD